MPLSDGRIGHRDLCTSAVIERVIGPASVSSLKIAASLQSDNFVTGVSGWKIERDTGSAEFQDVTVRGTLNADDITAGTLAVARLAADSITVDKLAAGTIGTHILKLSNSASSRIESNDGTSMIIRGDGSAAFTSVTISGSASSLSIASGSDTVDITAGLLEVKNATEGIKLDPNSWGANVAEIAFTSLTTVDPMVNANTSGNITLRSGGTVANNKSAVKVLGGDDGDIDFEVGAIDVFQIRASEIVAGVQMRTINGTAGAPGYAFALDTDTGMYRIGTNNLGFATAGAEAGSVSSTGDWEFGSGGTGKAIIHDVATSAAFPTYAFISDANTGMLRSAADTVAFATGGTIRVKITNGGIKLIDGTLAAPSYTFDNQTQTGVFLIAGGASPEIGIGTAGTEMFTGLNPSAGADEVRILPGQAATDGTDPFVRISSTGLLRKDSSARWLKQNISDAFERLVAVPIPHPSRFKWRPQKATRAEDRVDSSQWVYGWIADQWADALPEVAMYDADGEASNYELKGVVAHVAAHTIIHTEQISNIETRLTALEAVA